MRCRLSQRSDVFWDWALDMREVSSGSTSTGIEAMRMSARHLKGSVVRATRWATSGRAHNLVASIEVGSFWGEERKSDRQHVRNWKYCVTQLTIDLLRDAGSL
jgi:hypothetical protein